MKAALTGNPKRYPVLARPQGRVGAPKLKAEALTPVTPTRVICTSMLPPSMACTPAANPIWVLPPLVLMSRSSSAMTLLPASRNWLRSMRSLPTSKSSTVAEKARAPRVPTRVIRSAARPCRSAIRRECPPRDGRCAPARSGRCRYRPCTTRGRPRAPWLPSSKSLPFRHPGCPGPRRRPAGRCHSHREHVVGSASDQAVVPGCAIDDHIAEHGDAAQVDGVGAPVADQAGGAGGARGIDHLDAAAGAEIAQADVHVGARGHDAVGAGKAPVSA
jgi:hypothetical protein